MIYMTQCGVRCRNKRDVLCHGACGLPVTTHRRPSRTGCGWCTSTKPASSKTVRSCLRRAHAPPSSSAPVAPATAALPPRASIVRGAALITTGEGTENAEDGATDGMALRIVNSRTAVRCP